MVDPHGELRRRRAQQLGEHRVDQIEGRDQRDQGRDADDDARHHDRDIGQPVEGDWRTTPRVRSRPSAAMVPIEVASMPTTVRR